MVNRGGPSFSNDLTARRYETPIQLTVAFPARLSGPSWSIRISVLYVTANRGGRSYSCYGM